MKFCEIVDFPWISTQLISLWRFLDLYQYIAIQILSFAAWHASTHSKLEYGPMPNVMAALPNVGGTAAKCRWHPRLNAAVWLMPTAWVQCSNPANIGEHKTWAQSEFCSWQNSVRGKNLQKCIYSVPAQETAKHRAKFGWPLLSGVGALRKRRRETLWSLMGCPKMTNDLNR